MHESQPGVIVPSPSLRAPTGLLQAAVAESQGQRGGAHHGAAAGAVGRRRRRVSLFAHVSRAAAAALAVHRGTVLVAVMMG